MRRPFVPPIVLAAGFALAVFVSAELLAALPSGAPERPTYLYKVSFLRAAPGKLLELIDLFKERMTAIAAEGDARPMWWRHTQGDQWDLMIIFPMGSYSDYYSKARVARRKGAAAFEAALQGLVSWREDLFVHGPELGRLEPAFTAAGYFHIEIFVALPGKREALYAERLMENAYQTAIGRPENFVFVRDQGAAWDLFTLGCYRDLAHWASSPEADRTAREEAARRAGFAGADAIGPYMRTLIDFHRDTMGVAIR